MQTASGIFLLDGIRGMSFQGVFSVSISTDVQGFLSLNNELMSQMNRVMHLVPVYTPLAVSTLRWSR